MWSRTKHIEFFINSKNIANVMSKNIQNMSLGLTEEACCSEEKLIEIDGININYLKTGEGKHPVLLLPGALGTIRTDFKPQIQHLNKKNFTLIAWDPPGYGKSRPPDKTFPENFFRKDALWAFNLMKSLGYKKFSLLGWSDGGITSLILAANYPEYVHKMVVTGTNAYVTPEEIEIYEKIRNIDTWSEKMRVPLTAIYGEAYFRKIWGNWIDAMRLIFEKKQGDICKTDLAKIKCPTLIVHGEKDPLVLREHPYYLKENIKNARVEVFKAGAHNLHLRYPDEFNALVTKFLSDESSSSL